jgi:hypothetical protein
VIVCVPVTANGVGAAVAAVAGTPMVAKPAATAPTSSACHRVDLDIPHPHIVLVN